ncbi:MAG: HEAT repeat domain-containing protein [Candidatus Jordarchaeaceae archaeon]
MKKQYTTKDVVIRIADFLENPRIIGDKPDILLGEFIVACHLLGVMGDPLAVPTLIKQLKECGGKPGLSARYFMKAAADALIGIGKQAVEPLIELLKSEHPKTRKLAAYALGKIRDKAAFPALEAVFKDSKEVEVVREVAGRALLQLDPKKAVKILQVDNLTPLEDLEGQPKVKDDIKIIKKYYKSLDDLGYPTEYRYSISLYDYVEEIVYDYLYERLEWTEYFNPDWLEGLAKKLDLPPDIFNKVGKGNINFLLCLCGERLQRRYVDKLSKRVREILDDEGYHFKTVDIICLYCENCKRYTALERITDDAHPDQIEFFWFYLPRLPKQTELIDEKQLEEKSPTWENRIEE